MSQKASHKYEIEIKSLLGSKEKYDELKATIAQNFPKAQCTAKSSQLNHYFVGGKIEKLYELASSHVDPTDLEQFELVVTEGQNPSVRTRKLNDKVLLVIKASVDDTTSSNGIARIEFEGETPFMSFDELDNLVLDAGFSYQSKWSREREEFQLGGSDGDKGSSATLCIDKNAGYGYVAEIETVIDDPKKKNKIQKDLRATLAKLGLTELPQARLERMFEHYNKNWKEYYGTEKTFNIT